MKGLFSLSCMLATAAASIRGANSWDSELGNWDETRILEVAAYMSAKLLAYGYDHLTTDEGWYWTGDNANDASVDAYGRPTPRLDQYPSANDGRGFKTISDKVHALGLKFGVWTIRGVPKVAAANKLPIYGTQYTADQAVTNNANCSWNNHCSGCAPNADGSSCNDAAWAYYRSVASWYSQQGIDLVKIDCMWDQRLQGTFDNDVIAFTTAFKEGGITVSLSPGPVSLTNGTFISETGLAAQYRVSNDFWDSWTQGPGISPYPTGLRGKLDLALNFQGLFDANGTSPDLDMLPIGHIMSGAKFQPNGPIPTKLTQDEQMMVISLWAAVGAPLLYGGRLPLDESDPVDAFSLSILTNTAILAVHNASVQRKPITPLGGSGLLGPNQTYAWAALPAGRADGSAGYLTLLNGDDSAHAVGVKLSDIGVLPGGLYCAYDLWAGQKVPGTFSSTFSSSLRPHQAGVFAFYSSAEPC